jgi:iron complex outermembrane receptor protein
MTKKNTLSTAVKMAVLGLTAASMMPLTATAQNEEAIEEVMVTGSRIARDPLDYVGPMNVISNETITKANAITVQEILQEIPAVTMNGTNENDSNGGQGVRSVEMRNLGEQRTLLLVNGRRFVSTVLGTGLVGDLNNIPVNMIERVEVLGDGSSAVYGSDAVAGVVNVILKQDFEGVELSVGGGQSGEQDGDRYDLSMVMGANFDKGNITFGVSFAEEKEVTFADRSWSQDPVIIDFGGGATLNGSGIPPWGKYYRPSDGSSIAFSPDADTGLDFTECGGANAQAIDGYEPCRFNYNLGNDISLLSPNQKTSFFLKGNYELTDTLNLIAEVSYTDREGSLGFPGLPISGAHGQFTDMVPVPFTNPHIPSDALAMIQAEELAANAAATGFIMDWRAQDAGTRQFEYQGETVSTLFGLEGEFTNGWTWDAHFNWGRSEVFEETFDQVNVGKLRIAVDPDKCDADVGCSNAQAAPGDAIDIFGRGDVTEAFANYILFDDTELNEYEMMQIAGNVSGDLFELPAGTVGFAAGFEYREEEGGSRKSAVTQSGDSGGNFSQSTKGEYDVTEFYAEVNLPLIQDAPMAENLSMDLAWRYSDYNTIGDDSTYKIGVSWSPFEDLRLRAVSSTAFRAPNIMELFGGISDTFDAVGDPCSGYGGDTSTTVGANCAAAGVPAGYVQNAGQLKVSEGGNPDLEAETADNLTFGIVWTPSFIEDFSIALDYYEIEVDNAIQARDVTGVINNCYNTPGLSAADCARIGRNEQGNIIRLEVLNENLASLESSGVDMTLNYGLDTDIGRFSVNWLANYLIEYKETSDDGSEEIFTDRIAMDNAAWSGYPRIRSNLSFNLAQDNWDVGLTHRYIHDADADPVVPSLDVVDSVDAVHYFDLTGSMNFGNFRVVAGIENLTDEEPEYIPAISTNTSTVYDWMGRFYYTKVTYSF